VIMGLNTVMLFTKNRIIFIALILFFLGSMALVITFFLKPAVEIQPQGNENANTVGTIGGLPGTGVGFNANRQAGGGMGFLPNFNGVIGGGEGDEIPFDTVANGGKTLASPIIEDTVQSYAGNVLSGFSYYEPNSGALYRLTSSGERIELIRDRFPSVERIVWDAFGDRAILSFPDGSSVMVNFTTNERISLPRGGRDYVFQGDSGDVVFNFVTSDPSRNFLVMGTPDGSEARAIEPIGDRADRVQPTYSPDGSVVGLYRKSAGVSSEEIIFLGQQDENFKSMVVSGIGFKGVWTPDGNRMLYSVSTPDNNYNPTLWIVDARGDAIGLNNTSLGLSTSVDSCVMNSDGSKAYCSVQDTLPPGTGLYPELFNPREASIYEVNLETGSSKRIAEPVTEDGRRIPVEQLSLSPDGSELYFVEGRTGRVMKIQLQ